MSGQEGAVPDSYRPAHRDLAAIWEAVAPACAA
eukprot:CAMPEP_0180830444 /NCGR_PEP_ID=MMETSP1038_2-20121128/75803_1 /TAXON_ID=632150 /ORGANISM="Azadinium spinosum, Strain 3D9" /LENGTH=32 /DNA_ID= /DNA_START= /DNA_END= /DNA_ORIENTATION=